jgi:putative ABC transport system substrate-binding protein
MISLGGAATWPFATRAQQKAMPVIGYLGPTSPASAAPLVTAFREGLNEMGYVEGQTVMIEYRWAEGNYDRLSVLAADLIGRHVDVIAAQSTLSAHAAKRTTSTTPIVFSSGADPVSAGLIVSLARPGGNLTGVSFLTVELIAKRLELLSELVPRARVIPLLVNPGITAAELLIKGVQEAANAKGVQLPIVNAATEAEIDAAFSSLVQRQADALIVGTDPFFVARREQLVGLAAHYRLPAAYDGRLYAEAGGLISYGTDLTSVNRLHGIYVGKVLKGAKPGDLPVQQPTKFELIINLKTANTLALRVPQSMLQRATDVIE